MINETLDKMWNILKENDFQIDAKTKLNNMCTSCKNVLIQPYYVPCGCRYCYDCLISYLNGEEKFCLGDSEYCKSELIKMDTNVFFDQRTNIQISRTVVKCPMESCEFSIELGKMADHLRTCDRLPVTCPYYTIGCHDDKIVFDKMKQHFTEENYSHARLLMDFLDNWRNEIKLFKTDIKEQIESKQETISALEENVAKLLEEKRSVKEMETEKLYQNNRVEEMISALQTKSEEEIEIVKRKYDLLENNQKQMEIRMENLFQENKCLRDELETVKGNMTKQETVLSIEAKIEEQEQGIKANTEKVENLKQRFDCKCDQIEKNETQLKMTIDKMSQENAAMTTGSKKMESSMKTLETEVAQIRACSNCEFLWCIKNWDEKMKRAKNGTETLIYSDPFYLRNGYKMCLQLWPNDYGGTHLSLFVCIMRGEFDDILQWPFRHQVKLELLNQETGLAHTSRNVNSNDSPNSPAWKKPTSERNIGSYHSNGYSNFVELSELNSSAALSRGDQIWIRASTEIKQ